MASETNATPLIFYAISAEALIYSDSYSAILRSFLRISDGFKDRQTLMNELRTLLYSLSLAENYVGSRLSSEKDFSGISAIVR